MKIIKNQNIKVQNSVQVSTFNSTGKLHSGYSRVVRIITSEPVPQQVSFTGKIELK